MLSVRRYVTAGLLTAIPLWITWLIVAFIFRLVVDLGGDWTGKIVESLRPASPTLVDFLLSPAVRNVITFLVVIIVLYCLGWFATRILGGRIISAIETRVEKLPLVGTIYGGTKRLISAFRRKPGGSEQVVLINYPSPEMKTVGLVTRSLTDRVTGRTLYAVYVPTTPNPTSGFLEVVPQDDVVPLDWTVNEALAFVVSGGAIGPQQVDYERKAGPLP